MSDRSDLIDNNQVVAVVCNQWGDSGKGKIVHYLAPDFDVIARGTGGANAGHTFYVNGKKHVQHLVPVGISYDSDGKVNVLGNGMVIDPLLLCRELDALDQENMSYNKLMISQDAHVVMPYHKVRDRGVNVSQEEGGIGSTGKGIGPCYADRVARRGIRMRDLYDKDTLRKRMKKAIGFYPEQNINVDEIMAGLSEPAERLRPFIRNTRREMQGFLEQGRRILLEGAQGLLLSIEDGTYPHVTSSDPSADGTAQRCGLPARAVDLALGLVKFPYMTRVGGGPFPSELGGKESEKYCEDSSHDKEFELEKYNIPFETEEGEIVYDHHHPNIIALMNSNNHFEQGVGLRLAGEEYGATTGRPRRTGWTDMEALKYAISINDPNIVLTKIDVPQGANTFYLAGGYEFDPGDPHLNEQEPDFMEYDGFSEDVSDVRGFDELPDSLQKAIHELEDYTGARTRLVSLGPEQKQTIVT